MRHSILVLNGPNLGHLGVRQPEIYGSRGMDILPEMVESLIGAEAASRISLSVEQLNGEGQMIDRLERAWKDKISGVVLNAGAYTHTSLALADCLAWIKLPCVEVHLSNILSRAEPLRHQSLLAPHVLGVIAGFGLLSYGLAVQALWRHLQVEQP